MSTNRPKRLLLVTSSYNPATIADMHRARMLAWELPKLGWEVEVLAPGTAFQHPSCLDAPSLSGTTTVTSGPCGNMPSNQMETRPCSRVHGSVPRFVRMFVLR